MSDLLLITGAGCMIVLVLTEAVSSILRSQRYLLIGGLVGALLVPAALGVCIVNFGPLETERMLVPICVIAGFPTWVFFPSLFFEHEGALWPWGVLQAGSCVLNWILWGLAIGAVLRLLHARPGAARHAEA